MKFSQIRDGWMKTGIVSRHFKALETPYLKKSFL